MVSCAPLTRAAVSVTQRDLQVAAVKKEAVTELSKHIREAQRLQDLREADAVSLRPA